MSETSSQQKSLPEKKGLTEQEQLPQWTCSVGGGGEWTVGDKKLLQCQGDYVEKLSDRVQIQFKVPDHKYSLHVLAVKQSDHTSAQLVVTGYKAGSFEKLPMQLVDGSNKVDVAPFTWSVNTVIEKGQQAKPFGPMGPVVLPMPWWYWSSFVAAAVLIGLLLFIKFRKVYQRKKIIEELSKHSTALGPYNQFSKDMRLLIRNHQSIAFQRGELSIEDYLAEIDDVFRLYLVRELYIPAKDWGLRDITNELRARHRKIYVEAGEDIRRLLQELENARKQHQRASIVDCEQLAAMSRQVAEKIFQIKRRQR